MVWLNDARAPDGVRLYAIGDIHGCLEALRTTHEAIRSDLARRPIADWRIIHVGDYTDRGPDSRGVIAFLSAVVADERIVCLRGNHDQMILDCLAGETDVIPMWERNGAVTTLESYGLPESALRLGPELAGALRAAMPDAHVAFFETLPHAVQYRDYFFCHAGIEPGVALDEQLAQTLIWIRGPFLNNPDEHEAVIIHGHTPVDALEVRPNRIGIDTGAVYGGPLTCLVLEGTHKATLGGPFLEPIPVPA